MAFNLLRNTRAFFTTNVNVDGVVAASGFLPTNTFEIQVLEGLAFSQATQSEVVTLNEAGPAPARGQRSFNTALDPVEFSFSTYIRPKLVVGTPNKVVCEEEVLWNAFAGTGAIGLAGAGWTTGAASSVLNFTNSNAHQLQKFGMILVIEGATYIIDNCALDTATIDFGLDAIATIAWTGRGTKLRQIEGVTASTGATVTFGSGLTGTATGKSTDAKYLANKLSTLTLVQGINGGGTSYNIPITGGSLTLSNNLTYLTPANLGIVNQPITYFTGTRAVTGSITAYLRTGGTNDTSDLLNTLLANSATDIAPGYEFTLSIGGASNATKVEINVPAAVLTIPTVATEQVISTNIEFTGHGYTGAAYDIEATNEATITYHAA